MAKNTNNPFELFSGSERDQITVEIKKLVDEMIAAGQGPDYIFEEACNFSAPLGRLLHAYADYGASDTASREAIWRYAGGKPKRLPKKPEPLTQQEQDLLHAFRQLPDLDRNRIVESTHEWLHAYKAHKKGTKKA